jgi:hypothetical protein
VLRQRAPRVHSRGIYSFEAALFHLGKRISTVGKKSSVGAGLAVVFVMSAFAM